MRLAFPLLLLLLFAAPVSAQSNRPWLGVVLEVVDGADAENLGIPGGLRVKEIVHAAPADMAGLAVGDIVLSAGESNVTSIEQMQQVMEKLRPGDFLALGVRRESGSTEVVVVTLGSLDERGTEHSRDDALKGLREQLRELDAERRRVLRMLEQRLRELERGLPAQPESAPQPAPQPAPEIEPPQRLEPRVTLGVGGVSLTMRDARRLNVGGGVVVNAVNEDGPAHQAGLQSGDIITRVNDEQVLGTGGLRTVLARFAPGDRVVLHVLRGDEALTLTVELAAR